ncbi:MAG: hypothetical protein U0670_12895 [Anaerolineae bacterium]
MAQFIAFAPNVEVNGATVLSITAGMGSDAKAILTAHGLSSVLRNRWYSQQDWLDAFREIADQPSSMADLVSIGMEIPQNAIFPSTIDSLEAALRSIDVAYHENHRGGEIGHYHVQVVSDQQIDMICETPYPCDFDYGIIYSMSQRFCPRGTMVKVHHDDNAPCRKHGADSCTYHVTW